MSKKITISPITRLEGHGKIEIFLNDAGEVDHAFFQVPELRGFEKFCEGRAAEEMARITPRICGVCPTAHHMASAKALDDLFDAPPPPAARKLRELMYSTFMVEDHLLHFFFLGGPDFIVGPDAPAGARNILGVIGKLGTEASLRLISLRKRCREIMSTIGGKAIHPVSAVPGGMAKGLTENDRENAVAVAAEAVDFCRFTLQAFGEIVLNNPAYVELVTGEIYRHDTYYMGMVDRNGKVNFYDGQINVVAPDGTQFAKFGAADYGTHIAEHVEPWTYVKFPFLRKVGWAGFRDGAGSGILAVAPLARLNASSGMATPLAQAEYERMFATLGGKPSGHTLAMHWARLIEALYAAERMLELASDPEVASKDIRNIPTRIKGEGFGVVEAPRGTLYHHYQSDSRGLITKVNLIVATQNNIGRIALSIDKAAKALIHGGKVEEGQLNKIEMAFRAYDPCLSCATHASPGSPSPEIEIRNPDGSVLRTLCWGRTTGPRE